MDIQQEKITTLHDFNVNKKTLKKMVNNAVADRPVSVVMPMLYREITSDAIATIKTGLNKCTFLDEIIPQARKHFIH